VVVFTDKFGVAKNFWLDDGTPAIFTDYTLFYYSLNSTPYEVLSTPA
jgi:hypothetical protein